MHFPQRSVRWIDFGVESTDHFSAVSGQVVNQYQMMNTCVREFHPSLLMGDYLRFLYIQHRRNHEKKNKNGERSVPSINDK